MTTISFNTLNLLSPESVLYRHRESDAFINYLHQYTGSYIYSSHNS